MPAPPAARSTRHAPRAELARFAVAIAISSVLAAGFAIVVRTFLEQATRLLFGADDVLTAFRTIPTWARVVAPALGAALGAIVSLAATRLPESRGVGDVLEAVVLGRGRVSLRASLAKALASVCAIVGGGSLGREGPLIQVGAAIGGTSARWLGLPPSRARILLAAGTAAGFAAAYNTPIAAALFVLEIVTGVVALEVIVPVVVAAAIATVLSRLALGDGPFYGMRTYALVSPRQLASSIALGPLGGLAGVAFMELLGRAEALMAAWLRHRVLRAATGGLVVGLLATVLPEVVGNGAEAIREMLDGRVLGLAFVMLLVAKPLATTASVSTGSAGGVFTPSMFVGAALGGGIASLSWGGAGADRDPAVGAFALVGMASVVAATTHAPLMATVLAFEMSGDYAIVVPLLATTALATASARALRRDSMYTAELRRKGVPWDGSIAHRLARAVRARDLLEPALVLDPATPGAAVREQMLAHRARVAYCETPEGVRAIELSTVAGWAEPPGAPLRELAAPVFAVRLDDDVPALAERLWVAESGELPVLDAERRIAGIVTRRGLLGALDRELLERDLLLTRMTWSEAGGGALFELPRGQRIAVVPAPRGDRGRELDVLGAKERHGIWVVAVRSEGAQVPWRDSHRSGTVCDGDRWLVVGPAAEIDRLLRDA